MYCLCLLGHLYFTTKQAKPKTQEVALLGVLGLGRLSALLVGTWSTLLALEG